MSLIHEALKKAAGDDQPQPLPYQPRTLHVSRETFPLDRLVLLIALLVILLSVVAFVYIRQGSLSKEGPSSITSTAARSIFNQPKPENPAVAASEIDPPDQKAQGAITREKESVSNRKEVFLYLQRAEGYFEANKLTEAEQEYQKALSRDPDNAMIHNNLGLALKAQGRLKEAEAYYRAALDVDPNYVAALNNLGLLYDRQNRIEEAMRLYRKALRRDPDYAAAHLNYASALERSGFHDEALRHYHAFLAHASQEDQQAIRLVKKHLKESR